MTSETQNKPLVLNPLSLRNTVGGELADILEAGGIADCGPFGGQDKLRSRERLPKKARKTACELLGDPGLEGYLKAFEERYLSDKRLYADSYKRAKKAFGRLKDVQPLLRGEFNDGYDRLDDIIDFFGVESEEEIFKNSENQAALFRSQNKAPVNAINLYAWLRRGELDFEALSLPAYDPESLKKWISGGEWREHIEDAGYFKALPGVFAGFGMGLVMVPALPKTVYGAIRWIDDKPLIQISDRGRDLISCWFTLFHEIGHALRHAEQEIYEGSINDPGARPSKAEREANKFANDCLFGGDDLRKAVFERKRRGEPMTANSLAAEFGVKPILASYWLHKARYAPGFQRRIPIDFTEKYQ